MPFAGITGIGGRGRGMSKHNDYRKSKRLLKAAQQETDGKPPKKFFGGIRAVAGAGRQPGERSKRAGGRGK